MYVSNWSNFIGFGPPFTVVLLDLVVQSLSVCFVICDQKDDKAEVITNMPLMSYVLLYFSRQSFFFGGGVMFRLELQKGFESFSLNCLVQKVF